MSCGCQVHALLDGALGQVLAGHCLRRQLRRSYKSGSGYSSSRVILPEADPKPTIISILWNLGCETPAITKIARCYSRVLLAWGTVAAMLVASIGVPSVPTKNHIESRFAERDTSQANGVHACQGHDCGCRSLTDFRTTCCCRNRDSNGFNQSHHSRSRKPSEHGPGSDGLTVISACCNGGNSPRMVIQRTGWLPFFEEPVVSELSGQDRFRVIPSTRPSSRTLEIKLPPPRPSM